MTQADPVNNFRFIVEIDGIAQTGFNEVIMPELMTDVIEYREGHDRGGVRQLSGMTRYSRLVLRSGAIASMELYDWVNSVVDRGAAAARRNLSVILLNEELEPVVRWQFSNAWPVSYRVSDLGAEDRDLVIESIEIAFDSFRKEVL